jgi:hypothetical protein
MVGDPEDEVLKKPKERTYTGRYYVTIEWDMPAEVEGHREAAEMFASWLKPGSPPPGVLLVNKDEPRDFYAQVNSSVEFKLDKDLNIID